MERRLLRRSRNWLRACLVAVTVVAGMAGPSWAEPGTVVSSGAESMATDVPRDQKACDAGDAEGCFNLGQMYDKGDGVTQDQAKAAQLLQKACDGGYAIGCATLGLLHEAGVGVAKDPVKAARFYQKACDGGNARSCSRLGMLYKFGRGVPQEEAKAAQLYQKGCDGGDASGCSWLRSGHIEWQEWPSTAATVLGRDREERVKSVAWKDARGRPWRMEWTGSRLHVQAPTSRKAIGRRTFASNREDPDAVSGPKTYHWSRGGWECFVIQWDQRGVDMGRLVFWVIAVDSATGEWVLCSGRHWGEGPPSLVAIPQGLRLEWEDEVEDEQYLNADYRWEVHRNASSLIVRTFPRRYRVVRFYPALGPISTEVSSPNLLEAIHAGWQSLSWRLESAGPRGGRATSDRVAIPWEEQAAVLSESGRDDALVLPPKKGQEDFRWNGEVLLCLKGKRPVSISEKRAARLASSGSWGIVLVRSGAGPCEAWMLVEGSPEEQ